MNTTQRKTVLVPALLCTVLSPYSTKHQVEDCLARLLADEALLNLCIQLANQRHMVAVLFSMIKSHGLDHLIPANLHDYMGEMTAFMQQRAVALTTLTEDIIRISNQQGITPLLLKGSGTLFSSVYPAPGIRFMSDLDILYPAKNVLTIFQLLQARGFSIPQKYLSETDAPAYVAHPVQANLPDMEQHLLPLYREGAPCTIELHLRPLSRRYQHYLDAETAFASAIPIAFPNDSSLSAGRMAPENEVIYCFAHAQVSHAHHQHYYLDILQMDFFVRLVHHYAHALDWSRMHARVKQAGGRNPLASLPVYDQPVVHHGFSVTGHRPG